VAKFKSFDDIRERGGVLQAFFTLSSGKQVSYVHDDLAFQETYCNEFGDRNDRKLVKEAISEFDAELGR